MLSQTKSRTNDKSMYKYTLEMSSDKSARPN